MVISEDEICLTADTHEKSNNLPRYLRLGKLSWSTLKKDTGNPTMKLNLILSYASKVEQANCVR